jgi:hypothetical protein
MTFGTKFVFDGDGILAELSRTTRSLRKEMGYSYFNVQVDQTRYILHIRSSLRAASTFERSLLFHGVYLPVI